MTEANPYVISLIVGGDQVLSRTNDANGGPSLLLSGGGLKFPALTNGPFFGSGFGGIAYRTTGEAFAPEVFAFRAAGYAFESTVPGWWMIITSAGNVGIGIGSTDTSANALDKLHIRNGSIRLDNDYTGADYARLGYISPTVTLSKALTVSGDVKATGTINAVGVFQANGTAGVASFGPAAVTSLTVKNGIVVAIS